MTNAAPLWSPSAARIQAAQITAFAAQFGGACGADLSRFQDCYEKSLSENALFWREVWAFCGVVGTQGERTLIDADRMPGAQYFPDANLNYAENLLKHATRDKGADALVFWGEDKVRRRVSWQQLCDETSRVQQALRAQGLAAGDSVAAYLPNMPEAQIAMLGATSLGCVWTSCSPDFGVEGVIERFGQTGPRILIVPDGYYYNGKVVDVRDKVTEIALQLPTVERIVVVPYLGFYDTGDIPKALSWSEWLAPHAAAALTYVRVPFNAPLFILYSSGTTGAPKCIVHSVGGVLLQHLKEHALHCDIKAGDRVFYFTTCGWMMWNWLTSALAVGATLLLYDGSPFLARGRVLWDYAEEERMTHFGTSAKYIEAIKRLGIVPRKDFTLDPLHTVLSTGAPLSPECFDYVYQCVKQDVCLSSISGGTDLCACFAIGNPTLPVWRGELQCRALGMAVEVFDNRGLSVRGEKGELVCTQPFPSMPIGFGNDADGSKYRAAYFERFPDTWTHGDYGEITAHDGMMIYGRSDATLNPGGVRIGTAEIYRQLEALPHIAESLVIGQTWGSDTRVVLFVKLAEGVQFDDALVNQIKNHIRLTTTPRHAPAKVVQVNDIPRTKNGKLVELAVRAVVHGEPVRHLEALANPEALQEFRDREELKT